MTRRAVVLVSGGLDSATVLAIAREQGFEIHAISFDYGQRHRSELDAARQVCVATGVTRHLFYKLDTSAFRRSALTADVPVPKDRPDEDIRQGIPLTYVPARNTVFLSVALALAESIEAFDIFIGVNAVDYSGYPDCRPEFIEAFQTTANLATRAGVEGTGRFTIHTPLIGCTKAEIIQRGLDLAVDYGLTLSCYDPDEQGRACGHCDACRLRRKGFADVAATDPIEYVDPGADTAAGLRGV